MWCGRRVALVGVLLASNMFVHSPEAKELSGGAPLQSPASDIPQVPGEDVFGFTSPTDVGSPGDIGVALENDGAVGRLNPRNRAFSQKLELSHTFSRDWSFAASVFGVGTSLRKQGYGFDGVSVEIRHRLIERSATNPFALTLAIEPRWGRIDTSSGLHSHSYSLEAKVQVDAPISGRLFWGANASLSSGRARDALDGTWGFSSASSLSTAVSYAVLADKLWVGAEARLEQAWSTGFLGKLDGYAVYLGPTIAFKPATNVSFSAVVLPQAVGRATDALDLNNFERAPYRLKLAISF